MPRVALVNPGTEGRYAVSEPLNLGFIAGYLEQHGTEVTIIDEPTGQHVSREIGLYQPDLVGITATTPLVTRAYEIADRCRQAGILTVLGGVHATAMPKEALRHADVVVTGEGEAAMLQIVRDRITSGVVPGMYEPNIDRIPPPARHLVNQRFYARAKDRLGDTISHLHFVKPHTQVATILSSRGCPYRCIFCHNSWRPAPLRLHSPERIVSEIKHLADKYETQAIFFMDDNLLANKERLLRLCGLLQAEKLDISWGCNATANHIDQPIVEAMKTAGCQQVVFGWESGSQRILDVLKKRTTVQRNAEAIKRCKEAGLLVTGSFIIGNPAETVDDIEATMQFIADNRSCIDMLGVNICTPYPGTKLWEWCHDQDLIPASLDWRDLNQEDLPPITVCEAVSPSGLLELRVKALSVKSVTPSRIWAKLKAQPLRSLAQWLRSPSVVSRAVWDSLASAPGRRLGTPATHRGGDQSEHALP